MNIENEDDLKKHMLNCRRKCIEYLNNIFFCYYNREDVNIDMSEKINGISIIENGFDILLKCVDKQNLRG